MKLTLIGHDDRYAVEQLQLALFPEDAQGEATSTLHRGRVWLTATTSVTLDGHTAPSPDESIMINASSLVDKKMASKVPTVIYFCS